MSLHRRDKGFLGQHLAKDLLERHDMAACLPLGKEMAGAMPFPIGIAELVVIVLSVENSRQT